MSSMRTSGHGLAPASHRQHSGNQLLLILVKIVQCRYWGHWAVSHTALATSMDTATIESKLDKLLLVNNGDERRDDRGGRGGRIRQLLQELIDSEIKYVEDLKEVNFNSILNSYKLSQICRDYIHSRPDDKNIFYSLDRKYFKSARRPGGADNAGAELERRAPSTAE